MPLSALLLPKRLTSWMSSPVPMFGRAWRETMALRLFRLSFLIAALLCLLFGFVYRAAYPELLDPFWLRLLLAGGALAIVGASFKSRFVQQRTGLWLTGSAMAITGWIAFLTWANDLHPAYALGLVFTITVSALLTSVSLTSYRLVGLFLGFAIGATGLLVAVVPEPQTSPMLVMLSAVGLSVAVFLVVSAYLQIADLLEHQHTHLVAAQREARLGTWAWDVRAGRGQGTEAFYEQLGLPADAAVVTREQILGLVPPSDLDRLREALAAGRMGGFVVRIRPNGLPKRLLRLTAHTETDAQGALAFVYGTAQDLTEEAEREAALIDARDQAEQGRRKAEEFSHLKSALLAGMSHELRTPLTAISGYAEVLAHDLEGDARFCAEQILAGSRRLEGTITALLELAQLRAGRLRAEALALDLGEVARTVAASFDQAASRKQITLRLDGPAEGPFVQGDPGVVQRILSHLVSNGVKYTERGSVTVRVAEDAEGPFVAVSDTGPGIAPSFLPHLFDEFRQASEGPTRTYEGNGVGLALADQLVRLMGGAIRVESTLGVGTTFVVRLPPVAPVASTPAASTPAASVSARPAGAFSASAA